MYIPQQFEETEVEVLHRLIRAHPLGALVTLTPNGLDANHIPFLVHPEPAPYGTLYAHVARANPVWRDFARAGQALVIFQGPERFISPSWYPSKQETGQVVPTWNYAVVHAHGPLQVIDDPGISCARIRRNDEPTGGRSFCAVEGGGCAGRLY